jgi:hypothetical protein
MSERKIFPDDTVSTEAIRERMEALESDHTDDDGEMTDVGMWDEADRREYRGLAEVMDDLDDPPHNTTLIHENYFRDHIKSEFLECGGEYWEWSQDAYKHVRVTTEDLLSRWPFNSIDWDHAAKECRSDYSIVEVDGVTYYWQEA